MKIRHVVSLVAVSVFSGLILQSASAFAENYGIVYSGGEPLGEENVQIDPDLSMKAVVRKREDGQAYYPDTIFSDSGRWENAYLMLNGTCTNVNYFRVSGDLSKEEMGDTSVVYNGNENYYMEFKFTRVSVEGAPLGEGEAVAFYIDPWLEVGSLLYTDDQCTNLVEGIVRHNYGSNRKIFIETNIKLYRKDTNKVVAPSEGLFVKLYDIDAGQSYKILNSSNLLSRSNMYAKTTEGLNGDNPDSPVKNMYVADGNYIYSQIDGGAVSALRDANIYIKINQEVLRDGIDFVFGYASGAGSYLEYGAKIYKITYTSDENGTIDGIETESIIYGDTASGSMTVPKTDYEFEYWTADKDVTLENGETIKAGDPITAEQLKQVVVTDDLTFTAIHDVIHYEITYDSDKYGKISGIKNEEVDIDGNPTGSTSTPDKNYEFEYWIADKDVTLENGETIKAGDPITPEQIKQIVVNEDIKLTAVHKRKADAPDDEETEDEEDKEPDVQVPNSGFFTGGISVAVTVSVVGIILVIAIVTGSMPKITRKRVDFDK